MEIINVIQLYNGVFCGIESFAVHDEQLHGVVREDVERYCCQLLSKLIGIEVSDFDEYFENDFWEDNTNVIQIASSYI